MSGFFFFAYYGTFNDSQLKPATKKLKYLALCTLLLQLLTNFISCCNAVMILYKQKPKYIKSIKGLIQCNYSLSVQIF